MMRGSFRGGAILRAGTVAVALAFALVRGERHMTAQSACGSELRLLVLSADGTEADLPAIITTLNYLGTPYTLHVASQAPGTLTDAALSSGCHANYEGVIVTTGAVDNMWSGVLTSTELQALHTFETQFNIRQLVWYTFPNDFGLTWTGSAVSTIGAPMAVSLTTAGRAVFPYVNVRRTATTAKINRKTVTIASAGAPLQVEQAYAYLAQPEAGSSTVPLIVDGAGNTLAATTTGPDGRQILAVTFDSNAYSLQTLVFGYGLVNWVTRGVFLGERHVYMSPQVDDVFIDDDRWVDGTSCSLVGIDQPATEAPITVRMTGNDLSVLAGWQNDRNLQLTTGALRLTLAFNGWGTTKDYRTDNNLTRDTLTSAAKTLDPAFYWVSHTYDHPMLDGIGYAAALAEFTMNTDVARQLQLDKYRPLNLVTPNISGLSDPEVMRAAYDAGVRYVVTDTSIPGEDNPFPNSGIYNSSQPKILMIPRRPVNLFYNVSTPADWASEYNCIYHGYFGRDLTYSEILDFVSGQLLPYLLRGENDPWMFHQSNLVAYDGRHSLLTDLLDATLAKYNGYFTVPIVSPSMNQLGVRIADRMSWLGSNVTATLQAGGSIVLSSDRSVYVPVTGGVNATTELYAGQPIAWVPVAGGGSTTIQVAR